MLQQKKNPHSRKRRKPLKIQAPKGKMFRLNGRLSCHVYQWGFEHLLGGGDSKGWGEPWKPQEEATFGKRRGDILYNPTGDLLLACSCQEEQTALTLEGLVWLLMPCSPQPSFFKKAEEQKENQQTGDKCCSSLIMIIRAIALYLLSSINGGEEGELRPLTPRHCLHFNPWKKNYF